MLKDSGRAQYVPASDVEALKATTVLARTEGIIPALESRTRGGSTEARAQDEKSDVVIVNISGRGDKDMGILISKLRL